MIKTCQESFHFPSKFILFYLSKDNVEGDEDFGRLACLPRVTSGKSANTTKVCHRTTHIPWSLTFSHPIPAA